MISLRATFEPLAQIASISPAKTTTVIKTLEKWFGDLTIEEKGEDGQSTHVPDGILVVIFNNIECLFIKKINVQNKTIIRGTINKKSLSSKKI